MSVTSKTSVRPTQSTADWPTTHHRVVVVGGGTAGISVAARLCQGWLNHTDVAIIEPSDKHYYQPLWTLVGGGAAKREQTERNEASVIPRKAKWIRSAVEEFHPR
jgi:sulfide:quinone oxidoreductase